jgi:hypothetical protein
MHNGGMSTYQTPTAKPFYLAFFGSAGSGYHLPRYRKQHSTVEEARAEAARVNRLRSGSARTAEPAIIHGPTRDYAA